jgi:hypothetical protein
VFAAIAIQIMKRKNKDTSALPLTHIIIGSIVCLLLIVQIFWAYTARQFVSWNVWYYTHITMAVLIVGGGIANIIIGTTLLPS